MTPNERQVLEARRSTDGQDDLPAQRLALRAPARALDPHRPGALYYGSRRPGPGRPHRLGASA